LLNGGVGNLLGAPIGTLTLLVINELIRAAGVQSNFQAMVSGLLLYFFIVLQSVIMSLRDRRRFSIALPPYLRLFGRQQIGDQRER
jgi:simple sugar transport system permease protein